MNDFELNPKTPSANAQPQHIEFGVQIANEMLSRFSLAEQNETISVICEQIRVYRLKEAHEMEERIEIIKQSLDGIPIPVKSNSQQK